MKKIRKDDKIFLNNNTQNNNVNNNLLNPSKEQKEKDLDIDENIEIIEDKKEEKDQEIKYGFHGEKTDKSEK